MVMRALERPKTVRRTPRFDALEARQLLAAPPNLPPLSRIIPAQVGGIASGSDGALWFTLDGVGRIGRVTTAGQISELPVPNGPTSSEGGEWLYRAKTAGQIRETKFVPMLLINEAFAH